IYLFFRRQIKRRHVGMKNTLRLFFNFIHGLLNDLQAFPHFIITHQKPIIYVSFGSHWDIKVKFIIGRVWLVHPYIVIYPGRTQYSTTPAVAQIRFRIYGSHVCGTFDEYAVAVKQLFKFLKHGRESFQEFPDLGECSFIKVAFEPSDSTDISGQSRTADFLKNLINKFPFLHYIEESGKRTRVYPQNAVANNVVSDTR